MLFSFHCCLVHLKSFKLLSVLLTVEFSVWSRIFSIYSMYFSPCYSENVLIICYFFRTLSDGTNLSFAINILTKKFVSIILVVHMASNLGNVTSQNWKSTGTCIWLVDHRQGWALTLNHKVFDHSVKFTSLVAKSFLKMVKMSKLGYC